jgi:hypothetical protein
LAGIDTRQWLEIPKLALCYAQNRKFMKSNIVSRFFILCLVMAGVSQMTVKAEEVTKNEALAIAGKVVKDNFPAEHQVPPANIRIDTGLKTNDPFYVCNVGETGFVLVAKSDNCPPVLGFSWESNFPARVSELPALMNTIIDNIRIQCDDYASRDTVNPAILNSWQSFDSKKSQPSTKEGVLAPLLATSWNVDTTYFGLFPKAFKIGGSVPIAMAQIFRFYAYPSKGTDKLCYSLSGYGELCADLAKAHLRFDQMPNTYANPYVDTLVFYMSVACAMQPAGASLNSFITTMPYYFNYSSNMRMVESWDYNIGDVVRHQLSLRRPVPANWIGQSFVIDGYFPDNLYHFNMGLGGEYNGFYLFDYPVVNVDTNHSLMSCFTDYHPKSLLPAVTNLSAVPEGDSVRISWNTNLNDSLRPMLVRYVVLRDGLIPVTETNQSSVVVSAATMGGSSKLSVVTDFGSHGASELSVPFTYISNMQVADIPGLILRQKINMILGSSDLLRQPFVGELDFIRDLDISFADQRGLEKLPNLRNIRIDGVNVRTLRDGDYLQKLLHLRFYNCTDFNFTIFRHTRSLIQIYGYDYTPYDLNDFRHNTDLGFLQFFSAESSPNMMMDFYGADKYFPKLADFYVFHLGPGPVAAYETCFVSFESYKDIYPKIKSNLNLLMHTQPGAFAPCYPTPARNSNVPDVTRLAWQSNFNNESGVYYNVFLGTSRSLLDLVSVFQTEKFYDGTFEPNTDYFWRVEAYHADTTYYSGIYHFSTWQDLPIPFIDRFDEYYTSCPIVEESPFWKSFDNTLTNKAIASRDIKYEGFYSLELKPGSDAGLLIKSPADPAYYIEFRFLNKGGKVTAELLQKSGSSDDNIVNSKIEFQGSDTGLFSYAGSTFPFNFVPDQWNRINIAMNMTTGVATFSLNEILIKEWQWHVQLGGTANANPFKGIRFVNGTGSSVGSGFIDNLVVDVQNPLSTQPVLNPEIGMVYGQGSREVIFTGVQPSQIREIALYDIRGRKLIAVQQPDNLIFSIGSVISNGIYVIVVNPKDGRPFTRKIAVLD